MDFDRIPLIDLNGTLMELNASADSINTWKTELNRTLSVGIFNNWVKWMKTHKENPDHVPWDFLTKDQQSEILLNILGPRGLNFTRSVAVTTIYVILLLVGFAGNFLTCTIIICNSYMRVPSNYFLFSLAIADIITLVGGKCIENTYQYLK